MFKTVGGISFNLLDPDQKAMCEHIEKRKNRSGYMKRLIWNDMKGITSMQVRALYNEETNSEDEELTFDEEESLKGMI